MSRTKKETRLRILLLEDDQTLSEIIAEYLTDEGYEVVCAYDGNEAGDIGYEEAFDLFVFDVKVPYQSGFDVLKALRERGRESPAIFVTSLSSVDDLSRAYDAGCDDYLRKPFELQELGLRVKALIKRSFYHKANDRIEVAAGIVFDLNQNRLFAGDDEVTLAKKEAKLLKALLSHRGEVVTVEQLIEAAWDFGEEASEESLRTHIKNLRKYLGKESIVNIRGQGYQLAVG